MLLILNMQFRIAQRTSFGKRHVCLYVSIRFTLNFYRYMYIYIDTFVSYV